MSEDKKCRALFWLLMTRYLDAAGPGVITGAADDDPSGIGTYTMAGARFGNALLWTAFFTWPLMAAVQLACARVGMVTGQGLLRAFERKFPRSLVILAAALLFAANTLNVAADLSAMADATEILTGRNSLGFVLLYAIGITGATVFLHYGQIARILKWLALVLFAYVATAFAQRPHWGHILADTFSFQVPGGGEGWGLLLAILGTTISPYLFFWQASQEVEEEKLKGRKTLAERRGATEQDLFLRRIDVGVGTFFSNLVMFFIILTASLTLHSHGLTKVETSTQAAQALAPLAGPLSTLLYTLGVLGTGLLAIPTLTGSAAYALTDSFRWRQGLDEKWNQARAFYAVILSSTAMAVVLDLFEFNPLRALYWSAVGNGILAPFLLVALYCVIGDSKLMQGQPCAPLTRAVVGFTALLLFAALILMVLV